MHMPFAVWLLKMKEIFYLLCMELWIGSAVQCSEWVNECERDCMHLCSVPLFSQPSDIFICGYGACRWCANAEANVPTKANDKQISLTCTRNFRCAPNTKYIAYIFLLRCLSHSNSNNKKSTKKKLKWKANETHNKRTRKQTKRKIKLNWWKCMREYCALRMWIEMWKALRSNWSLAHFSLRTSARMWTRWRNFHMRTHCAYISYHFLRDHCRVKLASCVVVGRVLARIATIESVLNWINNENVMSLKTRRAFGRYSSTSLSSLHFDCSRTMRHTLNTTTLFILIMKCKHISFVVVNAGLLNTSRH